jgi:hypothetical protein
VAITSVHFPQGLLEELDRIAAERGVSRNRLIVESCRELVAARRRWPDGFFSNAHLTDDEPAELQGGVDEFVDPVAAARHSRSEASP